MKQIIRFFLILMTLNACTTKQNTVNAQNKTILKPSKVDLRVELLSIVFRLADSNIYNQNLFPKYVTNIENHFDHFKNHKLIRYIKNELSKDGVGYDAVMKMATSITEPPKMKPIIPFSDKFPDEYERWNKNNASKFLILLNQFYIDADCDTFFKDNKELYLNAANKFTPIYQNLDLKWYREFYGQNPKGEFRIINGLGNGGGNYGTKIILPDGKEIIYAILGTWSVDNLGNPKFEMDDYFPTLLHEFNHSFVNLIVEKYHLELQESGKTIFKRVKDEMDNQAYGDWEIMYAESLVRASVIKYMKDHNYNKKAIENELNEQLNNSFIWTNDLVKELERYDNNRDQYPTLESFMPEIVIFFNKTASEIDILIKKNK